MVSCAVTVMCSIINNILELAKFLSVSSFEGGSLNYLCILEVCGQLMRPVPRLVFHCDTCCIKCVLVSLAQFLQPTLQ